MVNWHHHKGYYFMASNYTINWTDGSLKAPFTLNGGTVDTTTTSLALTGKSSNNWGERLQENLLHLLENFASAGAIPNNPTIGQIWYNSIDHSLQVNTGVGVWDGLAKHRTAYTSIIPSGGTAQDPHTPIDSTTGVAPVRSYQVGDLWFDTSTHQLKYASHASTTPTDLTSSISWIPIATDRIDFPNTGGVWPVDNGTPDTTGYDSPMVSTYRKGHLWWDTTNYILRVYDGSTWAPYSRIYIPSFTFKVGATYSSAVVVPYLISIGINVPTGEFLWIEVTGAGPFEYYTRSIITLYPSYWIDVKRTDSLGNHSGSGVSTETIIRPMDGFTYTPGVHSIIFDIANKKHLFQVHFN
jgi:hypothetical protein